MSPKQVAKGMNISVQSVLRGLEKGEGEFHRRGGYLPISYNNGDNGATFINISISLM